MLECGSHDGPWLRNLVTQEHIVFFSPEKIEKLMCFIFVVPLPFPPVLLRNSVSVLECAAEKVRKRKVCKEGGEWEILAAIACGEQYW